MDTSITSSAFPAFSIENLRAFLAEGRDTEGKMAREIARRERVQAGDVSAMSPSEKLRFFRKGGKA